MKLSENDFKNYTAILREELIPAMGLYRADCHRLCGSDDTEAPGGDADTHHRQLFR